MISAFLVIFLAGLTFGNNPLSSVAGRMLLPVWSTKTIVYGAHIQELAKTDEAYTQCVTDMDACDDMSITGNLPILADVVLWFCIGGGIALLIAFVQKRKN